MNLKKSMYNIEVEKLENGNILLFNSVTSAYGIMNQETQKLYHRIGEIDEDELNSDDIKENIDRMRQHGFIVDKEIDEFLRIKVLEKVTRYGNKHLGLTIAPTLYCNMNCPYCYEEKINSRMDAETQSLLVKFVEKYIEENAIKVLSVSWYGGEPLLEKDTIYSLSEKFISICKDKEVQYNASIVSNGILLDYNTAQLLKSKCAVTDIQITIDGTKEVHNKRRVLKNNGDSFDIITKNIDACKDILNISIRTNIDKENEDQIEKLVNYFIDEKGWGVSPSFYIAPVDKQTDSCKVEVTKCFSEEDFGDINAKYLRLLYKKGLTGISVRYYPFPKVCSCGAIGVNTFVIDPDGCFYTCWDSIGDKNQSVGDLKNGINFNNEYIKWLSLELPERCNKCNLLPICQGGCPYKRIRNGNNTPCDMKKYCYKENLRITYEEYINDRSVNR